jgi:hypothetical protein
VVGSGQGLQFLPPTRIRQAIDPTPTVCGSAPAPDAVGQATPGARAWSRTRSDGRGHVGLDAGLTRIEQRYIRHLAAQFGSLVERR